MARASQESVLELTKNPPKEKRYFYNGYAPPTASKTNKPFAKRKVSPFSVIVFLFFFVLGTVFYIGNTIAVNRLVVDIGELQAAYRKAESMNEILRSEINRKSSMERITQIAAQELGMIYPKEPPVWFEVDETILHELEQSHSQ